MKTNQILTAGFVVLFGAVAWLSCNRHENDQTKRNTTVSLRHMAIWRGWGVGGPEGGGIKWGGGEADPQELKKLAYSKATPFTLPSGLLLSSTDSTERGGGGVNTGRGQDGEWERER